MNLYMYIQSEDELKNVNTNEIHFAGHCYKITDE